MLCSAPAFALAGDAARAGRGRTAHGSAAQVTRRRALTVAEISFFRFSTCYDAIGKCRSGADKYRRQHVFALVKLGE
jgi:hypothetical protein